LVRTTLPSRLRQGAALARDWIAPGEAVSQFTHFVTSVCNARCAHCFYPINAKKSELTLDEIDRLTRTMPPIRLLLISGGEPFLRRDLPEIIRLYFERCRFFTVNIPTNGFSADTIAGMTETMCGISPALSLGVTVSLDGFREYHDKVRAVPGLFDRALEVLDTLLPMSRRLPNLTVSVTTTFMRDNQEQLGRFMDFIWNEHRPNLHTLNLIRGQAYDASLAERLDIDVYEKLSRTIDARYPTDEVSTGWRGARTRARRHINRLRYEYIARQARGGGFEQFCLAGEREFVMTEDGNVHACELVGKLLGNVREAGYDFAKIREGAATKDFVTWKHDTLCRCTHECNTRTMLFFDRSNALPVLGAMAGVG
jgi:radical SAM protein with 4Fe4S-binding SPASM domain